ncbi:MAG: TRAM domain-containing protein [Halobacteria archaeon]|nr:TRAM domain-containing protein [Halobacteria archaeon]
MSLEISGKLLSLFSSRVEEKDGSYVIEIPKSEIEEGTISEEGVYRIGVITSEEDEEETTHEEEEESRLQPPVEEGEIRYVEIEDIGKQGDGIARVERGYVIIVPETDVGDRVKVEIEEVKENFAVAEVLEEESFE